MSYGFVIKWSLKILEELRTYKVIVFMGNYEVVVDEMRKNNYKISLFPLKRKNKFKLPYVSCFSEQNIGIICIASYTLVTPQSGLFQKRNFFLDSFHDSDVMFHKIDFFLTFSLLETRLAGHSKNGLYL